VHEGGKKAILAAFAANLGIAVIKFGAFAVTGATSMLAESIHSVADTGNQGLLLLGGRKANRAPDASHPFGYGRERYFWAFVVSIVLFTVGAVFALYEGFEKFRHPHEVDHVAVAVGVLLVAIVLETLSFLTARREALKIRGEQSWGSFIRRTKNPELAVVLLEDTGALLGLVFALVGVSLAEITGDGRWDAMGSIAIGLLLGVIAMVLAKENKSLLIGEAADQVVLQKIERAIQGAPQVQRLIHLRTLQLGPDDLLVTAKVELDRNLTMESLGTAIDAIEAQIRAVASDARLIFIEPDLYRPDAVAPPVEAPRH
jgi:cation diffusion facilitator family transporter